MRNEIFGKLDWFFNMNERILRRSFVPYFGVYRFNFIRNNFED